MPADPALPHLPVSGQTPARRRSRIRTLLRRMRERNTAVGLPRQPAQPRQTGLNVPRRRKRKVALALSAGALGLGSAAMTMPKRTSLSSTLTDASETRRPCAELRVSDRMREALVEEEGVRRTVYPDPVGLPTVGVGHFVTPADGLRVGDEVSYDRILDMFERDLRAAEDAVARLVGDLPLYQHEFDALVDLVYNVGEGGVSETRSPRLNAAIAEGDYAAIAAELAYHHAAGAAVGGLVHRSERRIAMFTAADYADPRVAGGAAVAGTQVA
jgi:GH24 family phage-related lysozyme (muramidase)